MEEIYREDVAFVDVQASELVIGSNERRVCDSFIFEPSPGETRLGRLYIACETESRNGVGKDLLELVSQAMQQEYFRDTGRSVINSFESALHQANLVLNDMSEQGLREWMSCFHVTAAVLSGAEMHICTAGEGTAYMVRSEHTSLLAKELSHSPITNPLRAFAQVASGRVSAGDTVFLGTSNFNDAFRKEDLARFSVEKSSDTIATRLEQLHADQGSSEPLAAIVVVMTAGYVKASQSQIAAPDAEEDKLADSRRPMRTSATSLSLRKPLQIRSSIMRSVLALLVKAIVVSWRWTKQKLWPGVVAGSVYGSRRIKEASLAGSRNVVKMTTSRSSVADNATPKKPRFSMKNAIRKITKSTILNAQKTLSYLATFVIQMPKTSKIFAVIALVMAVALAGSLGLLRQKRATDGEIQRASEILHDAQTKYEAAQTALVYDNRDKTKSLLDEASQEISEIRQMGFYVEETKTLENQISAVSDKLQKVIRTSTTQLKTIGDFATDTDLRSPVDLVMVNGSFYTFAPQTNEIYKMSSDGEVSLVSETTEGIGFLKNGIAHEADKNIVFVTGDPGIAIFDVKDNTLQDLKIDFNSDSADVSAAAIFGNRLYAYDSNAQNIFSFSKTLRGYAGASAWILDDDFDKTNIKSLAVDGSIYTLHDDGSVHELFKGEESDFKIEEVQPNLSTATSIYTEESFYNIYVTDQDNKRVVVFDKKGNLQQQVLVDVVSDFRDATVSPDEKTIYILDGTRVLEVPLVR